MRSAPGQNHLTALILVTLEWPEVVPLLSSKTVWDGPLKWDLLRRDKLKNIFDATHKRCHGKMTLIVGRTGIGGHLGRDTLYRLFKVEPFLPNKGYLA